MQEDEEGCATVDELTDLLGRARAKRGMFEGDMQDGELEIGQVSAIIKELKPAGDIVKEVWEEFVATAKSPFWHMLQEKETV